MDFSAYEKVRLARDSKRPTGLDYIKHVFTDFKEFHGDRRFADDPAIVAGIACLKEQPVTVIAIEKGHSIKDRMLRNSGAPHPEGYRKALRLMKQAEKFHRPVICIVDTSGAYCGIGAEERGEGQAIAENLNEMMVLKVPIISMLIGEGGSGGALGLAVADRVWMLENAIYSAISPEGCASILWKDSKRAPEAAESLKLTAADAKELQIVEKIILETSMGKGSFFKEIKENLCAELKELQELSTEELLEARYQRFRRIGSHVTEGLESLSESIML